MGPARGQVQVQGDLVAWLPRAAKVVISGENQASFGIMVFVVYRDAGVRAPRRDPEREAELGRGRGADAQVDGAGPRVVGGLLQVEVCAAEAGPGVLVDVQ